jgi:hypothetical protein
MSCCNPNYRNDVHEKEKEINQKGHEKVPLLVKVTGLMISIGGVITFYLL